MHIRAHTSILFPLQFVCVCEWVTMRKKNQLYQISSFLPPDYYHHYYYILLYFLVVISSEWFFSWCVVMCACVGLLVISTDWNKTTTTAVKVNVQIFCLFFSFFSIHIYILAVLFSDPNLDVMNACCCFVAGVLVTMTKIIPSSSPRLPAYAHHHPVIQST